MSAPAKAPSRWLFGPTPDLLLGCGLGYILAFAVLCVYGTQVRDATAAGLIPFLTLLIGAPHYGATLLRVYARRQDRRAYALFAVWVTALLGLAFAAATRSVWIGSLLLTVYLTWSPWHYTGQNYGLAVMFLRRRGVGLEPALKRCVYASFALSYAITAIAMHTEHASAAYAPSLYQGYHMLSLGLPRAFGLVAIPALGLAYLATLAIPAVLLLRRASARDLAPAGLLALTQALWFSIPVVTRTWGLLQDIEPLSSQFSIYYFFWAALGHSIQYVWVASYFARSAPGYGGLGRYLWKALLAGAGLWTVPALLFAPSLLGRIPFDAGLGALVASVVNLHHFVLDGAIWKLRDGRIARVLIRSEGVAQEAVTSEAPARSWVAPALQLTGALSLVIMLFAQYEQEFGLRRAWERGDASRLRAASERLRWIGRDSANVDYQLGKLLESQGNGRGALLAYQRSLDLLPSAAAWIATAELLEGAGQLDAAQAAVARALELAPDDAAVAYRGGSLALRHSQIDQARTLLERAVTLDPENKVYRLALERAGRVASD